MATSARCIHQPSV